MTSENTILAKRLERAQAEMALHGVDELFVTPSSDLVYLLGYPAHSSERLTLLGVPREGRPFVVVPRLEAVRLDGRRDIVDIHPWDETDSPSDLVASLVGDATGKVIAVSDQTFSVFLLRLQSALSGASWAPGAGVIGALRVIKDEAELAALREAGRLTDAAWMRFVESTRLAGMTELQAAEKLAQHLADEGLPKPGFLIVGSGPGSASPHHMTGERVIQQGDSVVFDFGSVWDHYYSDITRTVHVGEPSEEYRRVYETVLQANAAAKAAVRPGVACEAVDKAARDIIEAAGYGEFFIHRTGHGLGLDVHEEPYMVTGNSTPLQPGMVFSDEPGIYIPGKFGVRIEDILVCTQDGYESLNNAPRDLVVMD